MGRGGKRDGAGRKPGIPNKIKNKRQWERICITLDKETNEWLNKNTANKSAYIEQALKEKRDREIKIESG